MAEIKGINVFSCPKCFAAISLVPGFIAGAIVAVIYNLAAGIFGGLEITLAEDGPVLKEHDDEHNRSYE